MEKEPVLEKEKFVAKDEIIEGREKFGKNVEVRAVFRRHASKANKEDISRTALLSEE